MDHVILGQVDSDDLAEARGSWRKLSAELTEVAAELTGREEVIVTCAPGAGHGSPACFFPSRALIEVDGVHLGHDPATCRPSRPSDRERYPALWGAIVHEAAHARHTRWEPPRTADPAAVQAAMLLEEGRIEARHLRERPGARRWLRAAAIQLVLSSFTDPAAGRDPDDEPDPEAIRADMNPWDAATAAALLLGRVTAGVLDEDEVEAVTAAIRTVLSAGRLSALAALWHTAQRDVADDDGDTMLDLGARWCRILTPTRREAEQRDSPKRAPSADGDQASPPKPSDLAGAIAASIGAVTRNDAPPPPAAPPSQAAAERHAAAEARKRARARARRVFATTPTTTPAGRQTRITGVRPPTAAEQAAARRLARRLRSAAHRERVAVHTTSATPPGRLRMRQALAADAQRAAGAVPTAQPFLRTEHRAVPVPPLRVGIACDVSGSMSALAAPVASAAWILARATSHIPDADTATVIYGAHVRAVTRPGRAPTKVHEFAATDTSHAIGEAIDALDAALDLSRPGTARLLVVVSDGLYATDERASGQARVDRLTASGAAVLWLAVGDPDTTTPLEGAHLLAVTDPATAAQEIAAAAVRALASA